MEREYKEVTTPIGKNKVKIKAWLTGFEKREIQSAFLNETDINVDGGNTGISKMKGDVLSKAQDATINVCIHSIDDKTDNILEKVGNLHSDDFDFIVKTLNELHSEKPLDGKKKEK